MPTYGALRTKFLGRMNRRDLSNDSTGLADGFLQDAIRRIQRTLRIPAMEKAVVVPLDTDYVTNGGVPIPSDYLQLRQLTLNDEYELVKHDVSYVVPLAFNNTGMPMYFARRGGLWILGPFPSTASGIGTPYQLRIDYYAEFGALSEPDDEDILTDIADDLVLYGALSVACDHYNDKRGQLFEARYTQIQTDIEGMGDEDETSGSAAVQPAMQLNDDLEGDD